MNLLLLLHAFITLALIGVILLQKSDGGSGLLGSGGSGNLFTARGATNLLSRTTAILATFFMANCLLMCVLATYQIRNKASVLGVAPAQSHLQKPEDLPVSPAPVPAPVKTVVSEPMKSPAPVPAPASVPVPAPAGTVLKTEKSSEPLSTPKERIPGTAKNSAAASSKPSIPVPAQ